LTNFLLSFPSSGSFWHKAAFRRREGWVYLRSFIGAANEFGKNWRGYSVQNNLPLRLLDLREAP
jgi:hypothetical protein